MWKRGRLLLIVALIAVLIVAAVVVASRVGLWGTTYPPLGPVTRIEVKAGPDDKQVRMIDNPDEVRRVVGFVDEHRRGWGGLDDWAGVPAPQVSAYFYSGSQFKGHFGVGPGFFECQREGDFASEGCSPEQERQFLELIGLPKYEFRR